MALVVNVLRLMFEFQSVVIIEAMSDLPKLDIGFML